ncbi:MAG TPA: hypothetical protein VMT54_19720 [Candidatus Cybelea sp.]|nr:hypothetical protein [Candidatus Cybelea sp.]
MSEQATEHAGDESPEGIAFRLLVLIADLESKTLHGNPAKDRTNADRKWILDTYAEILHAVKSPHERKG